MESARRARRGVLIVAATCGVVIAAALVARFVMIERSTFYTDGDRIREPARSAPTRRILWQPAEPIAPAANRTVDEYEPRLSADGSSMVFVRGRAGANAEIYSRSWTAGGWGPEEPITAVNTEADELGPELSADGRSLYFYSDRSGGFGGYDVWVSTRADTGWGGPSNLGAAVNTEFNEYGPALTPDGRELFFASNRPRPGEASGRRDSWSATVREQRTRHDYDLYVAKLEPGGPTPASPLLAINTPSDEGAPALSPVGDFLYFASDRAGGFGGFDVYRSRRLRGMYVTPENLGGAVNSLSDDLDPGLSTDGFRLYFSSNRALGADTGRGAEPSSTPYAVWQSASREVFSEVDEIAGRRAMAGLWASVWPWLAVLVLALLLALALWWLFKSVAWRDRYRRLSLLAKCVLISLAIHALFASALAVWRVGSSVGEFLRRASGTRVVLASAGSASTLATQLRTLPSPSETEFSAPVGTQRLSTVNPVPEVPRFDAKPLPRIAITDRSNPSAELVEPLPDSREVGPTPVVLTAVLPAVTSGVHDLSLPREMEPEPAVSTPDQPTSAPIGTPSLARADLGEIASSEVRRIEVVVRTPTTKMEDRATFVAEPTLESLQPAPSPTPTMAPRQVLLPPEPPTDVVALPSVPGPLPDADLDRTSTITPSSQRVHPDPPSSVRAALPEPTVAEVMPLRRVDLPPAAARVSVADDEPIIEDSAEMLLSPPDRPFNQASNPIAFSSPLPAPSPSAPDAVSLRLPVVEAETPPVEDFAQRAPEVREQMLEQMGGNQRTERAVGLALDWFRAHQSADGHWSGRGFDDRCGQCAGPAEIDADAAMTGIVLLCYLGAGHTHTADGPYQSQVKRAIGWLVARQGANGDLRSGETMYSHTIATVALCEAFAMTRDASLENPTKRAASFLFQGTAKNGGRDGTSVLGWEVMAMESARRAGISTPRTTFDSARRFLDTVSVPNARGKYAYRRGDAPSAAMTAEAMFVQQLLGHSREEPRMQESANFILGTPPRWKDGAPTYYWYYATLALFQQQGEAWERWNTALTPELLGNQRTQGPAAGSWDPQDQWSKLGGRVYQTAICTLSLEAYYRYRAQGVETPALAPGPSLSTPDR